MGLFKVRSLYQVFFEFWRKWVVTWVRILYLKQITFFCEKASFCTCCVRSASQKHLIAFEFKWINDLCFQGFGALCLQYAVYGTILKFAHVIIRDITFFLSPPKPKPKPQVSQLPRVKTKTSSSSIIHHSFSFRLQVLTWFCLYFRVIYAATRIRLKFLRFFIFTKPNKSLISYLKHRNSFMQRGNYWKSPQINQVKHLSH